VRGLNVCCRLGDIRQGIHKLITLPVADLWSSSAKSGHCMVHTRLVINLFHNLYFWRLCISDYKNKWPMQFGKGRIDSVGVGKSRLPSNVMFLGFSEVFIPSRTSIRSAVFARRSREAE